MMLINVQIQIYCLANKCSDFTGYCPELYARGWERGCGELFCADRG